MQIVTQISLIEHDGSPAGGGVGCTPLAGLRSEDHLPQCHCVWPECPDAALVFLSDGFVEGGGEEGFEGVEEEHPLRNLVPRIMQRLRRQRGVNTGALRQPRNLKKSDQRINPLINEEGFVLAIECIASPCLLHQPTHYLPGRRKHPLIFFTPRFCEPGVVSGAVVGARGGLELEGPWLYKPH